MKCPFGYTDHPVTWRCHVVFGCHWLLGQWFVPRWVEERLYALVDRVERRHKEDGHGPTDPTTH